MKKPNLMKVATLVTTGLMALSPLTSVTTFCAPIDNVTVDTAQQIRKGAVISDSDKAILKSMFDAKFFAQKYPQIAAILANDAEAMFNYFVTFGVYEGKQPCAAFDVASYATAYTDLAAKFGTDVMSYYRHYSEYGKTEGRVLTTVDACKTAGIDTKLIESQRFTLNEEGAPVFVKFYNPTVKAFVYNEAEAKTVAAGTFSDYKTPVKVVAPVAEEQTQSQPQSEKKDEPSKQVMSYQEALNIWLSKMPDPLDYMTESEREAYEGTIEQQKFVKNIVTTATDGRMFESLIGEGQSYESFVYDSRNWADSFTDRVLEDMFESEACMQAWERAYNAWCNSMPRPQGYATEAEAGTAYNAAVSQYYNDHTAERDLFINGSGVLSVMAQNKYEDEYDLWMDDLREVAAGFIDAQDLDCTPDQLIAGEVDPSVFSNWEESRAAFTETNPEPTVDEALQSLIDDEVPYDYVDEDEAAEAWYDSCQDKPNADDYTYIPAEKRAYIHIDDIETWADDAPNLNEAGTTEEFWNMYNEWIAEKPTFDNGRYQDEVTWAVAHGGNLIKDEVITMLEPELYSMTLGSVTQGVALFDRQTGEMKATEFLYDEQVAFDIAEDDVYTNEEAAEAREEIAESIDENLDYLDSFIGKSDFVDEDNEHMMDDLEDWDGHEPEEGKEDYTGYSCPDYPSEEKPKKQ